MEQKFSGISFRNFGFTSWCWLKIPENWNIRNNWKIPFHSYWRFTWLKLSTCRRIGTNIDYLSGVSLGTPNRSTVSIFWWIPMRWDKLCCGCNRDACVAFTKLAAAKVLTNLVPRVFLRTLGFMERRLWERDWVLTRELSKEELWNSVVLLGRGNTTGIVGFFPGNSE